MSSGSGSEVDFDGWYSVERPRLVSVLLRTGHARDEAEEVADEAMARALARWSRVGRMSSPVGWTTVVAFNLARRRAARAGRERAILASRRIATTAPDPAEQASPEIWAAVRALPDRQRTMVVLRYVHDLTEPQIAKLLRVRRGAVASGLYDARQTLATVLGGAARERDGSRPSPDALPHLGAQASISSMKEGA